MEIKRKRFLESLMMDANPRECRLRIKMLRRETYITDREEQIAMIEKHLKSIGKD